MARLDQLSLDQAYQAAYLWLDHAGDPPIEISEPAHGSVELITDRAFVRVRSSTTPVEQSSVLALLRAAESGKRLIIFSPSGFSPGALSIAETQGIALFTLDSTGRAIAETTHARSIAPNTEPDPPFTPAPTSLEDDFWNVAPQPRPVDDDDDEADEADEGIQAATTDWFDCSKCGTTHHRNAKFCRECGASLTNALTEDHEEPSDAGGGRITGTMLRCRTCGSHDI
ncbi:MAG: zinc ribbon domain-containing protein, partial [Acidimicrobiia bacterium]|nr:zinc ribbon domain-containing protein [Acidimicrobiia bacterium]